MRADFKKWVSVSTRFRDVDPMHHINSTVFFVYFEVARLEYFTSLGIADLREAGKRGIPLVSQACNYRRQVFHPSTLDVGIRCAELREKTVHLAYEVYLEGADTLVADGSSISTWADLTVPKAIPLPDEIREGIRTFEGMDL